jgi:capsular exopolysaccharide synthesis family protein
MDDRMDVRGRLTRSAPNGAGLADSFRAFDLKATEETPSILTWEQVLRVLRKHRWFLAATIGGLTLLTVVVAFMMRDTFRPIARLEIDPIGGGITTLPEIQNPVSQGDQDYLDTQVQILQSDGLAMRVIRVLHLDQKPEFSDDKNTVAPISPSASLSSPSASLDGGSYLREQLDLASTTRSESSALKHFHQQLTVSPVRGSRVVEVGFSSHDPKVAQAVTNSLIAQFIDQNYRNHYVTTMETSAWLSSQLDDLRNKVAESNQAVTGYQKRYGLVESEARDVPLDQLMGNVSKQLSDAQADRIQAEASARMIDAGNTDAIPALHDDVVYQNLLTSYAQVRSQLAQAQTVYGEENVNVRKLKGQADELAAQVEAERGRLVNRVRSAFEAAKGREQLMVAAREKLRTQMGDASSHLVEYEMLKNNAIANANLYNTLQARLREAGIYAGLRSGNIRVVDMAPALASPTGPHRELIVALGSFLSIFMAVLVAFVWESFDNTVRIPDDIRNWLQLPSLAVVPTIRAIGSRERHTLPDVFPTSSLDQATNSNPEYPKLFWCRMQTAEAEAVRTLRGALMIPSAGPAPQVILVSSPSASEGKTTIALNLASVLAQQGKTCLIEGDLRRSMIASALHLNPRLSFADVLSGKQSVRDALMPAPGIDGLFVLPNTSLPQSPADLLASDQMRGTLETLRAEFEHVVIDSPPVLSFSDARTLAALSDAVILVSRCGRTTRRAITRSAELLAGAHANVLGVVLNDMDLASADYHYFNYGYSWAMSGRKYEKIYARFVPPADSSMPEPEKSKGAKA